MDSKVTANIIIAGRSYRLKIVAEDEKILRESAVFIKNKLEHYSTYSDQDMQDKLAVMLLNVTGELLEYKRLNDIRRLEIEKIDRNLGVYLEKQGSLDNIE